MEDDIWSIPCHTQLMADRPTELAIDCEAEGLAWNDKAFGASFAWYVEDELRSGYIDFRTHNELWVEVKDWLKESTPVLCGHNIKYDAHKLDIYPQANKFHDSCLLTYLLNENYPKALKVLASKLLKEDTNEAEVLRKARKENGLTAKDGYDRLPLGVIAPYAIKDAEYTIRLVHRLLPVLEKEPDLVEVYQMEKQLLLAVAGTERRGIGVDTDYLKSQIIHLGDEIVTLEREIASIVGRPVGNGKKTVRVQVGEFKSGKPKFKNQPVNEFNPNSPVQISEYFASVGVSVQGTSEDVLQTIGHPLAEALVSLRGARKFRNTFLVPILEESIYDERYGMMVCHPNLNLTKTRTKRMSSSGASDG